MRIKYCCISAVQRAVGDTGSLLANWRSAKFGILAPSSRWHWLLQIDSIWPRSLPHNPSALQARWSRRTRRLCDATGLWDPCRTAKWSQNELVAINKLPFRVRARAIFYSELYFSFRYSSWSLVLQLFFWRGNILVASVICYLRAIFFPLTNSLCSDGVCRLFAFLAFLWVACFSASC